jgi:hypothetical protein
VIATARRRAPHPDAVDPVHLDRSVRQGSGSRGSMLLPVGFGIQAIALLRSGPLARWQSLLLLVGVLLIGTPDGVEVVNLTASVLLTIAFVPYGMQLIRGESRRVVAASERAA